MRKGEYSWEPPSEQAQALEILRVFRENGLDPYDARGVAELYVRWLNNDCDCGLG